MIALRLGIIFQTTMRFLADSTSLAPRPTVPDLFGKFPFFFLYKATISSITFKAHKFIMLICEKTMFY